MAIERRAARDELEEFYGELREKNLAPLWNLNKRLLPREPETCVLPHVWKWKDLFRLSEWAGELVPIDRGGDRRVLALINPAFPEGYGATRTLWAAVQYLLPGETAPAHRHTPAAIRFIIQGRAAFTTVEGEKCIMERGDLILTPPWTWHDHGNETNEPMIWMDGLDLPLVHDLDAVFFEPYPESRQAWTRPVDESELRYGLGQLKPQEEGLPEKTYTLLNYKWRKTEEALRRLAQVGGNAFDDVALEFINPHTGGPVFPTLTCWIQLLRRGIRTKAHRQTHSSVYQVFEGKGYSVINGKRFDWEKGDMFVVPAWTWHEHASADQKEAILFSIHDTPVIKALGLYREEPYPKDDGHQSAE
jgi:gentisate 1,2-dioxygenase